MQHRRNLHAIELRCAADGSDIAAYALKFGLGAKSNGTIKVMLWIYYVCASGDDSLSNRWNHLFPLRHKNRGYMDLLRRRNILLNSILTFNPTEEFTIEFTMLTCYLHLLLSNRAQGPTRVTNTAFNPGRTVGKRDLGHEIVLMGTYKVNARSNLVLGD